MKKFIVASIIGTMSLTNINIVRAADPIPAPTPAVQSIDFVPTFVEATEPVLRTSDFTGNELIAYDSQSLPITLASITVKLGDFYYKYQAYIEAAIFIMNNWPF